MRANKIIRVKETLKKGQSNEYYKTYLMRGEDVSDREDYIINEQSFERYKYKWYDLRWIVDYPYFWFFSKSFKNDLILSSSKSKKIRFIILLSEGIIGWIISKILDFIF